MDKKKNLILSVLGVLSLVLITGRMSNSKNYIVLLSNKYKFILDFNANKL